MCKLKIIVDNTPNPLSTVFQFTLFTPIKSKLCPCHCGKSYELQKYTTPYATYHYTFI